MCPLISAVVGLAHVKIEIDRSSETIVANKVEVLPPSRLPLTRLPIDTRWVPMRPVSGADTCENSRSSWASRIAALAVSIAAAALRWSARR